MVQWDDKNVSNLSQSEYSGSDHEATANFEIPIQLLHLYQQNQLGVIKLNFKFY